ncbi:hypothetical protein GCM10010415_53960 [Streptomyces atrovirens]
MTRAKYPGDRRAGARPASRGDGGSGVESTPAPYVIRTPLVLGRSALSGTKDVSRGLERSTGARSYDTGSAVPFDGVPGGHRPDGPADGVVRHGLLVDEARQRCGPPREDPIRSVPCACGIPVVLPAVPGESPGRLVLS